jgi:3-deoxy-D-manno-octulosonic-acid transferase
MIGHLNEAYSAADLVFMGGSLIKHGGQNPIEPSYFARPVLFGPYMFNFRHVSEALLKDKAALQVFAAEDLFEKCSLLLADRAVAAGIGARAKEMVERNRGATRKNVEELAKVLA